MCHWDLRNRKTGIVSKCPVKGLHQFEGNSYCKRHFKALTTSTEKTNTQVATPEKSNSEVEPTPEKSNEHSKKNSGICQGEKWNMENRNKFQFHSLYIPLCGGIFLEIVPLTLWKFVLYNLDNFLEKIPQKLE